MGVCEPTNVERCVTALQNTINDVGINDLEVEFRLGRRVHQRNCTRFDPDITEDTWEFIRSHLESFRGWDCVVGTVACDFFLNDGVRSTHFANGYRHHVEKRRLDDVDLDTDLCFDVRMSLSTERPVDTSKLQPVGPQTFVRAKRRTSFRHKCWAIDLTLVTSNQSDDMDAAASYEIEVELLDKHYIFETDCEHVVRWGLMLCDQMIALVEHLRASHEPAS